MIACFKSLNTRRIGENPGPSLLEACGLFSVFPVCLMRPTGTKAGNEGLQGRKIQKVFLQQCPLKHRPIPIQGSNPYV